MDMIKTLAGLHWAVLALGLSVAVVIGFMSEQWMFALLFALIWSVASIPSVWLAISLERGKGRTVQTVLAVIWLFAFPVGTLLGVFALWVCWSGDSRQIFDDAEKGYPPIPEGPAQVDEEDTPPPRRAPQRIADATTEKRPALRGRRPRS